MEGLEIIDYTPAYAKAVAEMWQKSSEGWNGENANETEETVLAAHANIANINTYLAVLGDEVLGYCGFSWYREDEGALYIRTLNARYDHHGKGIGKALVKKSVERTIELKWPRLDLYTWPANTKSIPLYKKCGFFLENRQDTTHLMNFIPTVMQTKAVKGYFKDADWYDDMKRTINIEPDGRCENGFDFYEYNWDKNGRKLRMEFERKGRGLRLIETDDYMISLSAPSQNLVFGRSYNAAFEIINKTGKPLEVEITGRDDKNIKFSLHKEINVVEKEIVEGEFYISEIEAEFGSFKTHPGVAADININGEQASFRLGIVPRFPAKISLLCDDLERYPGETFNMFIDIGSGLEEKVVFEFELPECRDIEFSRKMFKIEIEKGQKTSIPVECVLKKPCIYQTELDIKAVLESGGDIHFKKNTSVILRGNNSALGGEVDDKYVIVNGTYRLALDKNNNRVEIFEGEKKKDTFIMYPKLGKPYSEELGSVRIKNVKWFFQNEKMVLTGDYSSNKYKNMVVKSIFKISNRGIFEHFYEVNNISNEEAADDIYIDQTLHYGFAGAYIPYDNRIIQVTEPRMEYLEHFDSDRISENWIYASIQDETESLIWPKNLKFSFDNWFMHLEHSIGRLKGGETRVTQPIYLALSTFKSLREARRFALESSYVDNTPSVEDYEININNRNPFVNESFDINIIENRELSYRGEITVKSKNNFFDEFHAVLVNEVNRINMPIHAEKGFEKDIICIESNFGSVSFERKAQVFYVKNMEFKSQVFEENGLKVYSANNGVINIKASPEFSTGIFSIQFMGREWLDNSFPDARPKSWYNPWFGGIQNVPEDLVENARTLLKEHVKMEFVEKADTLGNRWKGIKTSMCYDHNEDYKGLEVNQYFLMLPGVPVVLNMVELTNNINKYMKGETFTNIAFFKTDEEIKSRWVSVRNWQGDINKYRAGLKAFEIYPTSSPLYGGDTLEYKIQVNTDFNKYTPWVYLSTKDFACYNRNKVSLASGQRKLLPNIFYTFTKEHISDKLLKNLHNIRFE